MSHHHGGFGHGPHIGRRAALGGIGAALTLASLKPAFGAVGFPQRLVIINLLGGMDGLAAVVPYGDPALMGLRAPLVPPPVGKPGGMYDLGGFFGLNPAMPNLYAMFKANQMLAVHAVGGIVNTRSHFAGQTALQGGEVASTTTGWMNRLTALLPTLQGGLEAGVVFSPSLPLIAQGAVQMAAWAHAPFATTPGALAALVETLGAPDPLIGSPIESGFNDQLTMKNWLKGAPATKSPLQQQMQAAGLFLAASGGPAIALVEVDGLDTHTNQNGTLATVLADIDASIGVLAATAVNAWANTVVMTITEFGRTAYINGCAGTDHGTGLAMFLAGGAVAGGRVIGTWPGLGSGQLLDGRDLAPTTDIRAVIMGVLRDHLGLSASSLATVFPNATGISPMDGLVTS